MRKFQLFERPENKCPASRVKFREQAGGRERIAAAPCASRSCRRPGLSATSSAAQADSEAGGPVEAGLMNAPARDLTRAATLHILAIDPCVDFTLDILDA